MPQKRQLHDRFFRQAKSEGYVARSAYKLIEIDDKFKLLGKARKVLDLGCAPGSWLQVLAERCGPKAEILGIDLKAIEAPVPTHVRTLIGDVTKLDAVTLPIAPPFDVIISDMAPNTTGAGDDLRSAALCREVLRLCPALMRTGGSLVMKILEGAETAEVLREARGMFEQARMFKPQASRDVSRETFLIAQRFRAQDQA